MLVSTQLWVMPLFQGVLDVLLHNSRMHGVRYIEQVISITLSTFGVLIGEVPLHSLQGHECVIEVLQGELIKLWDFNEEDVFLPEGLLFLGEDILCVILREHGVWT